MSYHAYYKIKDLVTTEGLRIKAHKKEEDGEVYWDIFICPALYKHYMLTEEENGRPFFDKITMDPMWSIGSKTTSFGLFPDEDLKWGEIRLEEYRIPKR